MLGDAMQVFADMYKAEDCAGKYSKEIAVVMKLADLSFKADARAFFNWSVDLGRKERADALIMVEMALDVIIEMSDQDLTSIWEVEETVEDLMWAMLWKGVDAGARMGLPKAERCAAKLKQIAHESTINKDQSAGAAPPTPSPAAIEREREWEIKYAKLQAKQAKTAHRLTIALEGDDMLTIC